MNKPSCECIDLAKNLSPFQIHYEIVKDFNYSFIIECTKCGRRYNIELDVVNVTEIKKEDWF